jgi:fumarylacetoacetate (FAA) hydrolase
MKLASLKHGRDGQLIIVSQDLSKAAKVSHIAPTLQNALDNWADVLPQLLKAQDALESNTADSFDFDPSKVHSPLPRSYQWADGSAYVNHVELVRKARGAEMPQSFWEDPLMYQGGSDSFIGPMDDIEMVDTAWGIDFEGEVAVITDDVPMGVSAQEAGKHIKLIMLVNDVSLRGLIPAELGKGFGFFQSKPSSAFSPVAITPDELGDAWDGGKVNLPLTVTYNGEKFGTPNAGVDMVFDFPKLISHAAKTRPLCTGSIIGSGTVSNVDRSHGSACLAEARMLEIVESGEAKTPFMQFGDTIKMEMFDKDGKSIFGAIDQKVVQYNASKKAA